MEPERLRFLLDRYLGKNASEAEAREYEEWYERAHQDGIDLFTDTSGIEAVAFLDSSLCTINHEIDRKISHSSISPLAAYRYWLAAASLITAVLCAGWFFYFHDGSENVSGSVVIHRPPDERLLSVHNTTANIKIIYPGDGSLIKLMPGGTVRYKKDFGTSHRHVDLSGKAFFGVAKDSSLPFVVYANGVITTALGTSFTIAAFPHEDKVKVQLHSGRVVVQRSTGREGKGKKVYLLPGQQLSWSLSAGEPRLQNSAAAGSGKRSVGERKTFNAVFREQPLAQVLEAVSNGYGIRIHYDPHDVEGMSFSGSVRASESLSQVLERISVLYDLQITLRPSGYIINKRTNY